MSEQKPKRNYHYSSAQKAKIAANRAAKAAKKKAELEARKLRGAQARAARAKVKSKERAKVATEITKKLAGTSKEKSNILTGEELQKAPVAIQKIVEKEEKEVIFRPHLGPQTAFLSASETEVLYGGAAGGGKSYAMLVDPLRFAHNPNHRALLLRKSMPELLELIDKSRQLYPKAFPGARFREVEKRWIFPSGATLQFSFVDTDPDVHRFQGQAFTWIGIDEITHYSTPYVWDYLRSRLRRTDLSITPYMRCTANPGGLGGWWVKKMFTDPAPWGDSFWAKDIETGDTLRYPDSEYIAAELRGRPTFKRRFIPAKLTDNPSLMQSPEYMAMLASLPETQRKRLLEGDWDIADDCAFPEFDKQIHVVPNLKLPSGVFRFRACDYGYVAPSAVLWFGIDYDGTLYIYRELYQKGLDAADLAQEIIEIEANEPRPLVGVLDTESWAQRGQVGPSIAEVMMSWGVRWVKADKGPGSRLNGKAEVHRRLAIDTITERPGIIISGNCKNLIRTLPMLPLDPHKPEDVDTKFKEDHLYDALRYGVMSRMVRQNAHPQEQAYVQKAEEYQPLDSTFGY